MQPFYEHFRKIGINVSMRSRRAVAKFIAVSAPLLDGITELQSAPEVFRFIRKGCIFFENGWKLRLTLDETCCVGTGFYIFACVLRKLLESYAPLNTPVRLELFTKQQGRITEWTM